MTPHIQIPETCIAKLILQMCYERNPHTQYNPTSAVWADSIQLKNKMLEPLVGRDIRLKQEHGGTNQPNKI